ncbi:MAG: DNA-3-methyladenine glycosylase [Oscillospiraceae bacterium]|nr:DNA-3-methyladenine glycosylase [Oscillospiraceae bacterium]
MGKLNRNFYLRSAEELAPALLGKILVHKTAEGVTSGIIVETEAYIGPDDKGAHSCGGVPTARTAVMFGKGGFAYVYLIYGMYSCFNVVANVKDKPEAVLIRALEPLDGVELMKMRRGTDKPENLCSGPGKLCSALGITREQSGADLCKSEIFILDQPELSKSEIIVSPRINIDYAEEYRDKLWRYFVKGNKFVSKVPKRYRELEQQL